MDAVVGSVGEEGVRGDGAGWEDSLGGSGGVLQHGSTGFFWLESRMRESRANRCWMEWGSVIDLRRSEGSPARECIGKWV